MSFPAQESLPSARVCELKQKEAQQREQISELKSSLGSRSTELERLRKDDKEFKYLQESNAKLRERMAQLKNSNGNLGKGRKCYRRSNAESEWQKKMVTHRRLVAGLAQKYGVKKRSTYLKRSIEV